MFHNIISKESNLSLHIDTTSGIEHVYLADFSNPTNTKPSIHHFKGPFGSFINLFSLPPDTFFEDFIDLFVMPESPYNEANNNILKKLKESQNIVHNYLYLKIIELYNQIPESIPSHAFKNKLDEYEETRRNKIKNDIYNNLQELAHPYKTKFSEKILDAHASRGENFHKYNQFVRIDKDFWNRPTNIYYDVDMNSNVEYANTTLSLIPLLTYYCQKIHQTGLFFTRCKSCNIIFVTKNPHVNTLCSDACRSKQKAISAETYKKKPKDIVTIVHDNQRVYWTQKIKAAQLPDGTETELSKELSVAYEEIKKEAHKQKKLWKKEPVSEREVREWYATNSTGKLNQILRKYDSKIK